jgi:hypothetical protein
VDDAGVLAQFMDLLAEALRGEGVAVRLADPNTLRVAVGGRRFAIDVRRAFGEEAEGVSQDGALVTGDQP